MRSLCFWAFVCIALCGAFFIGRQLGAEKCRADYLKQSNAEMLENSKQSLKLVEATNEKVYSTAVSDIRDILRKKYTIAE